MARLAFLAALAAGAAAAFGCGPAKELPDEIPSKSPEPTQEPAKTPKSSEPAARAYAEKAVRAFTGNRPELVEKGKATRLVLKGKMLMPAEGQKVLAEATRTIAAAWPDRLHDLDAIQAGSLKLTPEVWFHRPRMWISAQTLDNVSNSPKERSFAADATAQHWMMLLLPLTDPKAVVYGLKAHSVAGPTGQPQAVQTLKLALGDLPRYDLTFDAVTHALIRVEYELPEVSLPVRRSWALLEHKVGPDGLNLPNKMQFRWNGDLKEDWDEAKWEFPASIPDVEFSPPQKR